MSNVVTTIEQSRKLIELGLDPKTADMYYTGHRSIHNTKEIEYTQEPRIRTKFVSFDRLEVFFPAWSLSALLEVMSKVNCISYLTIDSSYLVRCKDLGFLWQKDIAAEDPVIAAYEMVCWLLEQGFIKK